MRPQRARRIVGLLTAVAAVAAATLSIASPVGAVTGWTGPQVAVPASSLPQTASLAVDGAGHSYVAYSRYKTGEFFPSGIWIATNKSGTWVRTKAFDGPYDGPSIALDSGGKIHLALQRDKLDCSGPMCQGVANGISYATNASGHWVIGNVATGGDMSPMLRLFKGTADIVYHSYTRVYFATNKTGSWVRTTVAQVAVVLGVDLELTASGVPHIVYGAAGGLYHQVRSGTSFVKQHVDPSEVTYAVGGAFGFVSTTPVILYSTGTLYVVSESAGVWGASDLEPYMIDSGGVVPFVGQTSDGHLRCAYTASGSGVSVVTLDGGPISPVALTTPNGQDVVVGMGLSSAGKMRVLYMSTGRLLYLGEN
jgi:hypothetical protein